MPLFARAFATHYPDREGSPRLDHHIVLSGGLEVGGFYLVGGGPSEGHWSWGATLASGNADFIAGGYASRGEVCRTLIAVAFRRPASMPAHIRPAGIPSLATISAATA
jgi:hypothetical protein